MRDLSPGTWSVLLECLGPDEAHAAEEYVRIRRRVELVLGRRGIADARSVADEVLDRTAAYLTRTGEGIRSRDRATLFEVVSRNTAREVRRRRAREAEADAEFERQHRDASDDRQMTALAHALAELPARDRRVVLAYYDGQGASRDQRARLAKHLRTSVPTLRVRVHRIRERLRCSLSRQEGPPEGETLQMAARM